MRLYMERNADGSYQCYCNEHELNNHWFMVDKTLQALYDYARETLEGIAAADIEWSGYWQFTSSDKPVAS
jgi:hypothetical protein